MQLLAPNPGDATVYGQHYSPPTRSVLILMLLAQFLSVRERPPASRHLSLGVAEMFREQTVESIQSYFWRRGSNDREPKAPSNAWGAEGVWVAPSPSWGSRSMPRKMFEILRVNVHILMMLFWRRSLVGVGRKYTLADYKDKPVDQVWEGTWRQGNV